MPTKEKISVDPFCEVVSVLKKQYERQKKAANSTNGRNGVESTVLVVVGAGASFTSGLRVWDRLKEDIIKKAEECYRDGLFVEEAWAKLSAVIGLRNPDIKKGKWYQKSRRMLKDMASVESICSVAMESEVVGKEILQLFVNEYQRKFSAAGPPPQLGYELLAHLIKHKFIDNIVTFNFDEVLDRAIDNELGSDGFHLVLSDQQAIEGLDRQKPRLIKIHGTISIPRTMRFTRGDTGFLPEDTINLLDNTNKIDPDKKTKVNIISLGYSWNDKDFAAWAKSRYEYIDKIFVVTLDDQKPPLLDNDQISKKVRVISTKKLSGSPESRKYISLDQFIWALWSELEEQLKGNPRGCKDVSIKNHSGNGGTPYIPAERHILLGNIFGPALRANGMKDGKGWNGFLAKPSFMIKHTPQTRFLVETFLHLVKCKGMVNVSVMARDPRLYRYMRIMRSNQSQKKTDLFESIKMLRQSRYPDVKETYFANADSFDELIDHFLKDETIRGILKKRIYIPIFDNGKIVLQEVLFKKFADDYLRIIHHGPEVEVVSGLDVRAEWIFNEPSALDTHIGIQNKTIELLKSDWTHLVVVAETSQWLFETNITDILKARPKMGGKQKYKIFIIRASDKSLEEWTLRREIIDHISKEIKGLRGYKVFTAELPWWEHNRHLTLAFDEKESSKRGFKGGIYFRRRLKTSRIAPNFVGRRSDCLEVFNTFLSYARRVNESDGMIDDVDNYLDFLINLESLITIARTKCSGGGIQNDQLRSLLNRLDNQRTEIGKIIENLEQR